MKYIKTFENYSTPIFAIDVRGCTDEELLTALDMIEKFVPVRYNGSSNKFDFINYKDQSGKAWCWLIKKEDIFVSYFGENKIYINGIHTKNWYIKEMENMIHLKEFINIGMENIEDFFIAKKYNL